MSRKADIEKAWAVWHRPGGGHALTPALEAAYDLGLAQGLLDCYGIRNEWVKLDRVERKAKRLRAKVKMLEGK